jgi:hypothetical protein
MTRRQETHPLFLRRLLLPVWSLISRGPTMRKWTKQFRYFYCIPNFPHPGTSCTSNLLKILLESSDEVAGEVITRESASKAYAML